MAKFTTIKCWHMGTAIADPNVVKKEAPSLALIKKSILKHGYRAYATDERDAIESQDWYEQYLLGFEVRFYIDGSGVYRLVNCDLVESELYFERLNVPIGYKPWIFYSWQSDFNPSRSKIKDALDDAIKHINGTLSPRQPLEIVESTRPEDGAKDIVEAIRDNIDRSLFTVFDITNVSTVPTDDDEESEVKCYPNANVVYELSYALSKKQQDQVLIARHRRGNHLPSDGVPFDFSHNRRVDFDRPAQLKKDIRKILVDYLELANYIQVNS